MTRAVLKEFPPQSASKSPFELDLETGSEQPDLARLSAPRRLFPDGDLEGAGSWNADSENVDAGDAGPGASLDGHRIELPSTASLRTPPEAAAVGAEGAFASPSAVFRGFNPRHAAAIDVLAPRMSAEAARAARELADLKRRFAKLQPTRVVFTDASKAVWDFAAGVQLALACLAMALMIALGAVFILDHLKRLDPMLAYVGIGPTEVAASLSIAGLSVISSLVVTHFVPAGAHRLIVLAAFVVGLPLFLAGMIELLGRSAEGAEAPDYLAALSGVATEEAGAPASLWLAARLCGEWLLVSVLKLSIDGLVRSHKRTSVEKNPDYALAKRRVRQAERKHRVLLRKTAELSALKSAYAGRLAAYTASVVNAQSVRI